MTPDDRVQRLLDELDRESEYSSDLERNEIDPRAADPELELPTVRTGERVTIEPYDPGFGRNQDTTYRVSHGTTQIEDTTKHRPRCPSCGHQLANPDEPMTLLARCTVCQNQTCPECKLTCAACETPLCGTCIRGQGIEAAGFCPDCYADIQEELAFERAIARRERVQQEVANIVEQTMDSYETTSELALRAEAQKWSEAKERHAEARTDLAESWKQLRERSIEERKDGELSLSKLSHALEVAKFLESNPSAEGDNEDEHGTESRTAGASNTNTKGSLPILR